MKEGISLENKNIVFILKSFHLGGAEKQALFLANYLQNHRNCNVYIYSYIQSQHSSLFFEECKKYKLQNLFVNPNPLSASGRLKYLKRRIKIFLFGFRLRKHKPDIIIPYLNPPSIIANLCYKIAGAKITFWHHRGVDYYRNDRLEKLAAQRAELFIANSPDGKKELETVFNLSNNKVHFIPNFSTLISDDVRHQNKNNEIVDLKDKIVIGMIAHFRKEKQHYLLLESFFTIIKKHKDIHLVLLGDIDKNSEQDIDLQRVKEFIAENELTDSVNIFHNKTAQDILPILDIGVLISEKEGMPNVIMEYMAYNLPIVCSDHSGCKNLLGENYESLVNNGINDIEIKLLKLVENKEERVRVGQQNGKKLKDNFTIEKYIHNLTSILNK